METPRERRIEFELPQQVTNRNRYDPNALAYFCAEVAGYPDAVELGYATFRTRDGFFWQYADLACAADTTKAERIRRESFPVSRDLSALAWSSPLLLASAAPAWSEIGPTYRLTALRETARDGDLVSILRAHGMAVRVGEQTGEGRIVLRCVLTSLAKLAAYEIFRLVPRHLLSLRQTTSTGGEWLPPMADVLTPHVPEDRGIVLYTRTTHDDMQRYVATLSPNYAPIESGPAGVWWQCPSSVVWTDWLRDHARPLLAITCVASPIAVPIHNHPQNELRWSKLPAKRTHALEWELKACGCAISLARTYGTYAVGWYTTLRSRPREEIETLLDIDSVPHAGMFQSSFQMPVSIEDPATEAIGPTYWTEEPDAVARVAAFGGIFGKRETEPDRTYWRASLQTLVTKYFLQLRRKSGRRRPDRMRNYSEPVLRPDGKPL